MGTGNMSRAVSILSLLLVLFLFSTGHAVQVQLVWDAPTTNADGTPLTDLAGYKVYYGQSSRNYGSPVDVGNQTTYILAGLSRGETYYFAVTAYDTSGNESEFSEEVTYTVPAVDTDGDGLFDDEEIDVYGTDPTLADTDGDGLNDGEEVAFWGEEWSLDIDGDGLSNLLDADSDGDGFEDGVEVSQGFDPGDPHSFPTLELVKIWQEGEDGELDGAMKVAVDSDASMEQFIWVPYENEGIPTPPDATGEATYRFVIPEAGTYALWGRLQAGEEGTGAFSLALDGGEIYSWWEIPALSGTGNVYDLSPSTYQVGTVQVGETYYIDRSYTITEVPAGLEGLTLIK
ncbi:MAG: fibronectin type III domain-containing protein, partial [Nitrospinota bacterium]